MYWNHLAGRPLMENDKTIKLFIFQKFQMWRRPFFARSVGLTFSVELTDWLTCLSLQSVRLSALASLFYSPSHSWREREKVSSFPHCMTIATCTYVRTRCLHGKVRLSFSRMQEAETFMWVCACSCTTCIQTYNRQTSSSSQAKSQRAIRLIFQVDKAILALFFQPIALARSLSQI